MKYDDLRRDLFVKGFLPCLQRSKAYAESPKAQLMITTILKDPTLHTPDMLIKWTEQVLIKKAEQGAYEMIMGACKGMNMDPSLVTKGEVKHLIDICDCLLDYYKEEFPYKYEAMTKPEDDPNHPQHYVAPELREWHKKAKAETEVECRPCVEPSDKPPIEVDGAPPKRKPRQPPRKKIKQEKP